MIFLKKLGAFLTDRVGGAVVNAMGATPKLPDPPRASARTVTTSATEDQTQHTYPFSLIHGYDRHFPDA